MRDFSIISDSCCSLSQHEIQELGLIVLPLSFLLDGKNYLDIPGQCEISPHEFYQRLADGADCKTAAVNESQFHDAMKEQLDAGKDVLCISFSSALSSTYHAACMAADSLREQYPDAKLIVVDSLCACRGLGMLLNRTVRAIRTKHLTIEEAAAFAEAEKHRQGHWFFVDDLTRLKHGGRISTVAAIVGGLMKIKPVMHCDANGCLTMVNKVRGTRSAMKALLDRMESTGVELNPSSTAFICHADCMDSVGVLSQMITDRFGITDIRPGLICPVIGAHTGIGTIGLFFVAKER